MCLLVCGWVRVGRWLRVTSSRGRTAAGRASSHITDEKQTDAHFRALLARAAGHVGGFYAGVKTTGVFCIATCRARKRKRTKKPCTW